MGIPFDNAIAVAGGNFGQANTPSWVYNLIAHPHAEVAYRGVTLKVNARPASDAEFAEIIARAAIVYPPATGYVRPASGREVKAFILEPAQ